MSKNGYVGIKLRADLCVRDRSSRPSATLNTYLAEPCTVSERVALSMTESPAAIEKRLKEKKKLIEQLARQCKGH